MWERKLIEVRKLKVQLPQMIVMRQNPKNEYSWLFETSLIVQSNLSNTDTEGTDQTVRIIEVTTVTLFLRLQCRNFAT